MRMLRSWCVAGCAAVFGVAVACGGGDATAPLPPTAIALASGDAQTAETGVAFSAPLVVRVVNAKQAGVSGVAVTFAVASGAGTVSPASATTDNQGQASTTVTAGATPGPLSVTARATGVTATVSASFTVRINFGQLAGQWDGTTSQSNQPVYLRITPMGVIDSLTVRTRASLGIGTCTATMSTKNVQIGADGSFSAPLSIPLLWTTALRGGFTSSTDVTGVLDALQASGTILCGSTLFFGSGAFSLPGGTWTARKR